MNLIDNRDYDLLVDENEKELLWQRTGGLYTLYKFLQDGKQVGDTVEIINASFELDPYKPYLQVGDVKKPARKYIQKEHEWYLSKNRSISPYMDDVKIWNAVCSKDEEKTINSNYGWCIFSDENGRQYYHAVESLKANPNSRQALMIYTRPSIHKEWNEYGKHDFICTNTVQCFIRDNILIYRIDQRSCDWHTGLWNDFTWHCTVYQKMFKELKEFYPNLKQEGKILYNIGSLHSYERSFELLKSVVETVEQHGKIKDF